MASYRFRATLGSGPSLYLPVGYLRVYKMPQEETEAQRTELPLSWVLAWEEAKAEIQAMATGLRTSTEHLMP